MMMKPGGNFEVACPNVMQTAGRKNALKELSCRRGMRSKKSSFSQSNSRAFAKDFSSKRMAKSCDLTDLEWTDKISDCPVYHPSKEDFADPLLYLHKIASQASNFGICKIVSPLKASVPAADVLKEFEFQTYVQFLQLADRNMNGKVNFELGERKYTYNSFKRMADKEFGHRFPHSSCLSPKHLEKKFWHEMSNGKGKTVEYAVNVDGSAFSSNPDDRLGTSKWNLKTLPRLPNSILRLVEHEIPGITYPMLYIGMLFSMFAWHVEDHYLYSINYHHSGAPKTWYGVPGDAAQQFEKVVLDHVHAQHLSTGGEDGAFKDISEKTTMFSPRILLQHSIPVYKAVQMPGEFVITFPRAYHAGFSNGFNCGEAVNFAIGDWFPFAALASKRYARLGIMAILPSEELLCKEAACVSKLEGLECSSAELASHHSVKVSFFRHMWSFNNALWRLKNNVGNLRASSVLLPNSHGTSICGICNRDCYLAFLECNCCYHLHCLLHENKSLDCLCGGKYVLFVREDIRDMEDTAQKFKQEGILEVDQLTKCSNTDCTQPNLISCIKSECIPCCKESLQLNSKLSKQL